MFKFNEPSGSIGLQFWSVYSKWQMEVTTCLKPLKITHTQFVIMSTILWCEKNDHLPTQVNIVNITAIEKMTLSKSVKELVAQNLVFKTKSLTDSRVNILGLSKAGLSKTVQALSEIEALDVKFFARIGNEKRAMFHQLLCDYRACL